MRGRRNQRIRNAEHTTAASAGTSVVKNDARDQIKSNASPTASGHMLHSMIRLEIARNNSLTIRGFVWRW